MAYKALYRKWRPEVFDEVIGQDQVIRTLKNQVRQQEVSHAYLFSGMRGTGKTSTAKIFARAINCLNPQNGDPCNVCQVCRGILSEQMMDVLEIDAASNNGVDHIREIRENVKYSPVKGCYKVYIVDEVHMLSTGAFNALLKTLEEPPDHVVFILATTEIHKIPATVMSRCLRLSFKPLGLEEIRQRLVTICHSLDVEWEERALTTIALNGEGALRDALSILDQCLAYHPGSLSYAHVVQVLGSIDESLLFRLATHIGEKNPLDCIRLTHSLYLEGKDLRQMIGDLMKHYRWLLMASLHAAVEGWEALPESTRQQFSEQAAQYTTPRLTWIIRQLAETEMVMKQSSHPQLILENSLVALCQQDAIVAAAGVDNDQEQLVMRIQRIEDFLHKVANRKKPPRKEEKPTDASSEEELPVVKEAAPDFSEKAESQEESGKESDGDFPPAETGTVGTGNPLSLETLISIWPHVMEQMRKDKKVSLQAIVREAELISLEKNKLTLAFPHDQAFLCQRLDREDLKEYVSELIQQKTGRRVGLVLTVKAPPDLNEEKKVMDTLKKAVPESLLEIEP